MSVRAVADGLKDRDTTRTLEVTALVSTGQSVTQTQVSLGQVRVSKLQWRSYFSNDCPFSIAICQTKLEEVTHVVLFSRKMLFIYSQYAKESYKRALENKIRMRSPF